MRHGYGLCLVRLRWVWPVPLLSWVCFSSFYAGHGQNRFYRELGAEWLRLDHAGQFRQSGEGGSGGPSDKSTTRDLVARPYGRPGWSRCNSPSSRNQRRGAPRPEARIVAAGSVRSPEGTDQRENSGPRAGRGDHAFWPRRRERLAEVLDQVGRYSRDRRRKPDAPFSGRSTCILLKILTRIWAPRRRLFPELQPLRADINELTAGACAISCPPPVALRPPAAQRTEQAAPLRAGRNRRGD